jgi:hypothetical protein
MEPCEQASLPPHLVGAPPSTIETTGHLAMVNFAHIRFILRDWSKTEDLAGAGLEKA